MAEKVFSPGHPTVGYLHLGLADLFFVQGRYDEAEGEFRSSLSMLEKALPPAHPGIMDAKTRLGECLFGRGQYAEAEVHLLAGYEGMAAAAGPESSRTQRAVESLVKFYESTGDVSQAADWRARLTKKPGTESTP